jgi:hypothetical protein
MTPPMIKKAATMILTTLNIIERSRFILSVLKKQLLIKRRGKREKKDMGIFIHKCFSGEIHTIFGSKYDV